MDQHLLATQKLLEQLQLRPSDGKIVKKVENLAGLTDPSFDLKDLNNQHHKGILSKLEQDDLSRKQRDLISEFEKQSSKKESAGFYSNLSILPKSKQIKTVTYQRIHEIQSKMNLAADRNEESSLKAQFDKLNGSDRFHINFPKSMEELGSKANSALSQNKMDFLRRKFRNEINRVATDFATEIDAIGQDRGLLVRKANEQIEANLDELEGIRELKRIEKAISNQEYYNLEIRNEFTSQIEKLGLAGAAAQPQGLATSATVRLEKQASKPKEAFNHSATVRSKRPAVEKGYIMSLYQQEFHKRSSHKNYLQGKFKEMQVNSGEAFECQFQVIAERYSNKPIPNFEDTMHTGLVQSVKSKRVDLGTQKKGALKGRNGGYTKMGQQQEVARDYLNVMGSEQKMTKRYSQFKMEQKLLAENMLTLVESKGEAKSLQVSTPDNNPYHGQFSQISIDEEPLDQTAVAEEIKAGSIALKKAPTFGTIEGDEGFTRKAFTVNQKMTFQNRNMKLLTKAIPPLMIVRSLFFEIKETHDMGGQKYEAFDPITRRYLDFCLFSGQDIEDFVFGLRQEEVENQPIRRGLPLQNESSLLRDRKTMVTKPARQLGGTESQPTTNMDTSLERNQQSGFISNEEIDDFGRHGSILTDREQRHNDFMEYMKKMGMKEYEYGTVVFYVDDTDNFRSAPLNQSQGSDNNEEADFDANMLSELFDPANPIKVSKENKQDEILNQSSFLDKSYQLQLELMGDHLDQNLGDFDLHSKMSEDNGSNPDILNISADRETTEQLRKQKNLKAQAKKKKKNTIVFEYFDPIVRKAKQLQKGNTIKAKIFKKLMGTKEDAVAAKQNDFDKFGRRTFIGNIKKQRGNLQGDFHHRFVVMRGWKLYWYRKVEDQDQKGTLILPSQPVVVKNEKKICFTLPEYKDDFQDSRAMSFGMDFNTRVFRLFVSLMILYKIVAEELQRKGKLIDPQVERFFRVHRGLLQTQYRQYVDLKEIDLREKVILDKVLSAMVPFRIDKGYDQVIRLIRMEDCGLNDLAASRMIESLQNSGQNQLFYLNLSKNQLSSGASKIISNFLMNLDDSRNLVHLLLDDNPLISEVGFNELQNGLMSRFNALNQVTQKEMMGISSEEIIMPVQTLSMANCSITDQSFLSFLEKMKEIMSRHQLYFRFNKMISRDYHSGGMAVCFARNKITLKSVYFLSQILSGHAPGQTDSSSPPNCFGGFRMIDLSHQNTPISAISRTQKEHRKIEQVIRGFGRAFDYNYSVTHLNLRGFKFSGGLILDLMKSISLNHVLQEIKLDIEDYSIGKSKEKQSLSSSLWCLDKQVNKLPYKQRLNSQYSFIVG